MGKPLSLLEMKEMYDPDHIFHRSDSHAPVVSHPTTHIPVSGLINYPTIYVPFEEI